MGEHLAEQPLDALPLLVAFERGKQGSVQLPNLGGRGNGGEQVALLGIADDGEAVLILAEADRFKDVVEGSVPESVLRRFTGHHSEEMTDLYDAGKEIDFQKARTRLEELTKPQGAKRTRRT